MTLDLDALEQIAREATPKEMQNMVSEKASKFRTAFNPEVALALIAEIRELQAKLDKVREMHRKWTYYDHEDMCPDTTEEHCEQRHHESDDIGEFYCEDMPTGDVVCEGCRDEFGERVDWPCPTVQALDGVPL